MSYPRWFGMTLLFVLTGVAVMSGINVALDSFGVFRDTHGRRLVIANDERTAKVLMNWRYVPENFDALLIGSSLSSNWDLRMMPGARIYNESLYGGVAAEEKILVEEALERGHFRYAICILNPVMTKGTTLQGGMETTRSEALGSIDILREESFLLSAWRHPETPRFADGQRVLDEKPVPRQQWLSAVILQVDPVAVEGYRALLNELRGHGIRLVFVIPPVAQPELNQVGPALTRYEQQSGLVAADEAIIDFNAPQYAAFRADDVNYFDALHLTPAGARRLSDELMRRLQRQPAVVAPLAGR